MTDPDTVLRIPAVAARTGLSASTVYRLIKRGEFVTPVRLSPGRVGFLASDVAAWLRARRRPAA